MQGLEHVDYAVLVAFDPACAQRLKALPDVQKLSERYLRRRVGVFLLNAEFGGEGGSVSSEVQRRGLDLPVLMDDRRLILDSLGLAAFREAMVFRSADWGLLWEGDVDGLSRALGRVVAGKKPPRSSGGICEPG